MINILSMDHFQQLARAKFTDWYNAKNAPDAITPGDTFIVWSCKALQNYKALVSTNAKKPQLYAEYTYNGDNKEIYEDVYEKLTNRKITEE